jgi:hypothetical protein
VSRINECREPLARVHHLDKALHTLTVLTEYRLQVWCLSGKVRHDLTVPPDPTHPT